jgi:hypothetical protein
MTNVQVGDTVEIISTGVIGTVNRMISYDDGPLFVVRTPHYDYYVTESVVRPTPSVPPLQWWQPANPGIKGWWEHYRVSIILAALFLVAAWLEGQP